MIEKGLLVTRNGEAERLTELSANPKSHVARLQEYGGRHRAEGDVRGCVGVRVQGSCLPFDLCACARTHSRQHPCDTTRHTASS